MKQLPTTQNALLLRTDFSDDPAWSNLCIAVQQPGEEGFAASLDCVSDPAYDRLKVEEFVVLSPKNGGRSFAFIADRATFTDPDRPILVVDLWHEPGRTFRVILREIWGIENNLSISNMDFFEFADNVDPDGVFRGFA